ncbi:peptidase C65 Otubain-domain-containing protein [Nemania sp. FL0916]|nr:peptidase C65 Otubain-domain-containing protein [Nemania sp. FL0916]
MFQPQPTPYLPFSPYGLHGPSGGIPDYAFAPTPLLGQFGGGHVGGSTTGSSDGVFVGGSVGRPGPSTARPFPAVHAGHFLAGARSGPAGMAVGVQPVQPVQAVQGLGSPTTVDTSDHSASYSSSSASSIHPRLYNNLPMPISVPRHHPSQQHQQQQSPSPQHQNQQQPPPPQQQQQQHPHPHPHQESHPTHLSNRSALHYKMDQQMGLDPNEICQQEAAASEFEPQLEGPLVGEKVSSSAITAEYARADPTYVAKTMALPQTYSHYRPIQGDGNCGWRAIAFAYFEILVQSGTVALVQNERQRILDLNQYIEEVGGQERSLLDIMVEETFVLFDDIIATMADGNDAMPNVVAKFNDIDISRCLVYHLRLMAGARLKGKATEYEPYLDGGVENYLQSTVMPVNREIDHICVALVHDILLRPIEIVLDIAYLDRSEGTEVNVHRFPEEANGQDPSTLGRIIYLLYRPGHYDILYRDAQADVLPIPVVPAPVDLQINRVTSFMHHNHDFENPVAPMQNAFSLDMSALAAIPGFSSLSQLGPSPTTPPSMVDPYAHSPSSWVPQHFTPEIIPAPPPSQPSPPEQRATLQNLRFSKYNFPNLPEMAAENNTTHEPAFQTTTFKNSHFNTAHYNNTNFQPEMYQPGADEEVSNSGSNKGGGRKRSTEHCLGIKREK